MYMYSAHKIFALLLANTWRLNTHVYKYIYVYDVYFGFDGVCTRFSMLYVYTRPRRMYYIYIENDDLTVAVTFLSNYFPHYIEHKVL